MYGLLYIQFQIFMFLYVMFMACLALPILLPINIIGGSTDTQERGWAQTTATNIPRGSDLLAAHVVLACVFQILALVIIVWFQQLYFRSRRLFRAREYVNSHTVYIYGISRRIQNGGELQLFMEQLYPDQVAAAHIGYHAPRLTKLKRQKENGILSLEHEQAVLMRDERRPKRYPGTCGVPLVLCRCRTKQDSIDYWKAKIPQLSARVSRLQKRRLETTGVAFVTFYKVDAAHKCLRDFYVADNRQNLLASVDDQDIVSHMRARQWSVSRAPPHGELFWDYLKTGRHNRFVRRLIITVGVVVAAALWAIPISFLTNTESLVTIPGIGYVVSKVINWYPLIQQIIEGYLPSLFTSLLVVVLPDILKPFCNWEHPHYHSSREASLMRHYYVFVILNVFVFPLLFIGSFNSYIKIANEGFDAFSKIDWAIQGAYFINYILQQTFTSGAMRLLRPHLLFIRQFKLRYMCVSDSEFHETRKRLDPLDPPSIRLAQMTVVLAMIQTFAVIVPLILVVGIAYFLFLYLYDKNNILHVYPRDQLTDSSVIPNLINQFLAAQVISNAVLIVFFYIKGAYWGLGISCGLAGAALLIMLLLNLRNWWEYDQHVKKGSPYLVDYDVPLPILQSAYLHPGLVPEEDDIEERIERARAQNIDLRNEFRSELERATAQHTELERSDAERGIGTLGGVDVLSDDQQNHEPSSPYLGHDDSGEEMQTMPPSTQV